MPLLQKAAPPVTEPIAAPATGDRAALLAHLLGAPPARSAAEAHPAARPRRSRNNRYDRGVQLAATAIGLAGCALIWLIGSYFTLRALAALGVGLAATGLAPVHALLQIGPAAERLSTEALSARWPSIVLAWALPLGVTLLETGFDPARTSGRSSRLIWGVVLSLDAVTSALGMQPILARLVGDAPLAWALAAALGIILAVLPEKLARRLILENV